MGDDRKMDKAKFTRMHGSRPTIGLLIGRLGDVGYAAQVWPGVADVAEERDVNLICFVGGALRAAHEFDSQRNVAYDLASPENVDGLIAMSGSIGQFIGPEQLKHFYKRYHPLPMVSVAMALDGIPSVLMDNKTGMRDAITHLIDVHKLNRIAFIRGPETNPEAEERYRTYAEVLAEHGIPLDPDLVAPGNFLSPAGEGAIRLLLDERKANFQAVASANDEMAFGAMTALRERGMRVPDDVSVVGFDDLEEARFSSPPLTTIRQPLYEQGRRAAEILLALLAGENVPERVALPTELVLRQSCGCFPQAVYQTSKEMARWTGETAEATIVSWRERILSEMVKAVNSSAVHLNPGWAEKLLDAFSDTLEAQPRDVFLPALNDVLRQVGAEGDDVMQWYRVLDVLRHHALPSLASGEALSRVDDLWQRAGALIGEVAQWAQANRRLQAERRAFDFTTRISEPLMTAFDVAGLTDVVAHQLPQMGIMSCYLALYEQPIEGKRETPTEWSRLILAYNRDGRIELETDGRRFLSRQLVPEGILPREKRFAVMLEPIHFRDEIQLGFVIFEPLKTEVGALREALSRQISTALKGALLMQERTQTEEALNKEKEAQRFFSERLTLVLDTINELSKIGSFDELCRRSIELAIERLGFDRVGLCFLSEDRRTVLGVYGTDEAGHLRNEKHLKRPVKNTPTIMKLLKNPESVLFFENEVLLNDKLEQVGIGDHAVARLWNGEKIIGIYAADNLIHQIPITDEDLEILGLYGTAMGHLFTLKQADEALQVSEQAERHFQQRLRTLLEVGNDLSRTDSVDALCRQAVELGRAQLGFDRLGIWLRCPDPGFIVGSYGIDEDGNLRDEREVRLVLDDRQREILAQTRPLTLYQDDVDLFNGEGNIVGRGARAQAAMWDGEKVIGFISADNLLKRQPITDHDCDLLNLYASNLGYLCSRKQAEKVVKEYSERLEEMVEERTKELQDALQKAQAADRLKSEFVANINHELRTPLTNLILYYQMLSAYPSVKTSERLGVIGRELQRLRSLIENLLNLSRLELEQVTLRPMPHDLNKLMQSLANDRSAMVEERGLTLTTELHPNLPSVWLDEAMIVQAVSNLLTNAMNYTPAGGQLYIRTMVLDDQSGKPGVAISVQDTGPGIDKADLPHIFERFYRGSAGHETGAPGTGLGLAIVKQVVEKHHGRIEVENTADGHGAVFTVWLPVEQEREAG